MTGHTHRRGPKAVLEQRLRTLAKNLDAISKGVGSPGQLIDDFMNVAEALLAFNEAYGRPEEELIRRALAKVREEQVVPTTPKRAHVTRLGVLVRQSQAARGAAVAPAKAGIELGKNGSIFPRPKGKPR